MPQLAQMCHLGRKRCPHWLAFRFDGMRSLQVWRYRLKSEAIYVIVGRATSTVMRPDFTRPSAAMTTIVIGEVKPRPMGRSSRSSAPPALCRWTAIEPVSLVTTTCSGGARPHRVDELGDEPAEALKVAGRHPLICAPRRRQIDHGTAGAGAVGRLDHLPKLGDGLVGCRDLDAQASDFGGKLPFCNAAFPAEQRADRLPDGFQNVRSLRIEPRTQPRLQACRRRCRRCCDLAAFLRKRACCAFASSRQTATGSGNGRARASASGSRCSMRTAAFQRLVRLLLDGLPQTFAVVGHAAHHVTLAITCTAPGTATQATRAVHRIATMSCVKAERVGAATTFGVPNEPIGCGAEFRST